MRTTVEARRKAAPPTAMMILVKITDLLCNLFSLFENSKTEYKMVYERMKRAMKSRLETSPELV